jgi:hypothetical protein
MNVYKILEISENDKALFLLSKGFFLVIISLLRCRIFINNYNYTIHPNTLIQNLSYQTTYKFLDVIHPKKGFFHFLSNVISNRCVEAMLTPLHTKLK